MYAKLTMLARITEPKTIQTSSGVSFVNVSMVTNRYLGPDKEPVAEWYDFKAFGKTAERLSTMVKGTLLFVEATPTIEKWIDKTTEKEVKKIVFLIDKFIIASSVNSTESTVSNTVPKQTLKSTPVKNQKPPMDDDDLEDPFLVEEDNPF